MSFGLLTLTLMFSGNIALAQLSTPAANGSGGSSQPASCQKSMTMLAFELQKTKQNGNNSDFEARKMSDGWHLTDFEGGDVFIKQQGNESVPCVRYGTTTTCGDQINNGGKDLRDTDTTNGATRIHETKISYVKPNLLIQSVDANGNIDKSKPYLEIDGSASTGKGQNASDSSLHISVVQIGGTQGTSSSKTLGEINLSEKPNDSQTFDKGGTQCQLNGLVGYSATVTDDNTFDKTNYQNGQEVAAATTSNTTTYGYNTEADTKQNDPGATTSK